MSWIIWPHDDNNKSLLLITWMDDSESSSKTTWQRPSARAKRTARLAAKVSRVKTESEIGICSAKPNKNSLYTFF